MDGQVLLLLIVIQSQVLAPGLRREDPVLIRNAIHLGLTQLANGPMSEHEKLCNVQNEV
jgi:hypothetical protein